VTDHLSNWIQAREDELLDEATVPSVSLASDGTIQFANDAWLTLTGYDRETVVGRQFSTLVPDAQATRIDAALRAVGPDRTIDCDVPLEHEDDIPLPVHLTGEVEVDSDGTVTRIHCQARPRMASATPRGTLGEQNALLRTLLDGLPVGILAETTSRTVLAVNDELLSMFDIPQERHDIIGADCAGLAEQVSTDFDDPSEFVTGIENRIDDGEPVLGELLERADGRVFERSYLPIKLPSGRGHLWVYEEVTDEQSRKAELETYERLVEVAPVGVFRTTTDGRVLTTNQRMADILGYEDESELLEHYQDIEQELYVDPQRRRTFLDRLRSEDVVKDFEYEAQTKNGGRRWLSMNARLLEERDDGARVITGFTWDLTERKRRERQLAVLGRILRHNLRNALTVIEGQADLLASGSADSPQDAREMIGDHADALLSLADKERAIAKLLQGTTEQGSRDLNVIAETVRAELLAQYPEATIDLSAPKSAPASVCLGFEEAIRELLENAIVHSESDDPQVTVTIRTGEESVDLEVVDTGPGFPEIEQRVLRGEAAESPLYHSAGIGLFLVRQLVHASNGRLSVDANEPNGSVVRIRLLKPRA